MPKIAGKGRLTFSHIFGLQVSRERTTRIAFKILQVSIEHLFSFREEFGADAEAPYVAFIDYPICNFLKNSVSIFNAVQVWLIHSECGFGSVIVDIEM